MLSRRIRLSWIVGCLCAFGAGSGVAQTAEDCPPRLKAGDAAADDLLGCAVSLAGGFLVVGSLGDDDERGADSGSAYLFERAGGGWEERDKMVASDRAAGDQFGYAVAMSGDLVVVGAPFKNARGAAAGAAYVFRCNGPRCADVEEAALADLVPASVALSPFDQFGLAVAIDGTTVAVGVPGAGDAGAVDLFERRDGRWSWHSRVTPANGADGAGFGFSVALRGGTLVAGAPFAGAGAVYVFEKSGASWRERRQLTAGAAGDAFGYSVALGGSNAGATAVVGAPRQRGGGAAYVLTGSGSAWRQDPLLPAGELADGDQFGVSVAVNAAADRVLVGARGDDERGPDAGAAYVFAKQGGSFQQKEKLLDVQNPGDEFGLGAAIDDGVAVAGAFKDDEPRDSGAAYAFFLDRAGNESCGPILELTKSGPEILAETSFVYTVKLTNRGAETAREVVLEDRAPPHLSFERVSPPCTDGSTGLPCRLGDLGPEEEMPEVALEFSALPTACNQTTISNRAIVRGANFERQHSDSPPATVDCGVDLAISSQGPPFVLAGESVTYRWTISNSGTGIARGVQLENPARSHLELVRVSELCAKGFPCDLGDLPAGETPPPSVEVEFMVQGSACSGPGPHQVLSSAHVSSRSLEKNLANNTSRRRSGVYCADLAIAKDGPPSVVAGTSVTYRLTVTNLGPETARGVRLEDPTPRGLELVEVGQPCASGFPCGLGDLPTGASVEVEATFFVLADACCASIDEITNEAVVSSTSSDPDLANNRASTTTEVECRSDLAIEPFSIDPDDPCPEAPLSFTVAVTNEGDSDVCSAEIRRELSAEAFSELTWKCSGSEGARCTPDGDLLAGAEGLWDRFDLPAGGRLEYAVEGIVAETAAGPFPFTALAKVPSGTTDPVEGNDSHTASFSAANADLALKKTAAPATVLAGNYANFAFAVSNSGPCPATGIVLEDPLLEAPSGGLISCEGPCDGGLPCPLPDLPANGATDLAVSCGVDPALVIGRPPAAFPITNEARVSLANPDPEDGNNTDSATVLVRHRAELELAISNRRPTAFPFERVTYTTRLTNRGPSALVDGLLEVFSPTARVLSEALTLPPGPEPENTIERRVEGNIVGIDPDTVPLGEFVVTASVNDPQAGTLTARDVTLVLPQPEPGFMGATLAGTMTVSGQFSAGGRVTYRVLLLNGGPADQDDNDDAEPEFELLNAEPSKLRLLALAASTGTTTMPTPNEVEWNGVVAKEDYVELTLWARVTADAVVGDEICNQGVIRFDSDGDGDNDEETMTFFFGPKPEIEDPDMADPKMADPEMADPEMTCFWVADVPFVPGVLDIPAAAPLGLALLALLLAALGLARLRR